MKQVLRVLAYLLSALLGYLAGHWLLTGNWAILVSILVAYHLFLAYLVFSAEHKAGFSLPVGTTLLTHAAFLAIIICLGIGGRFIPFFRLISLCIPALAPFESHWLFSSGSQEKAALGGAPVNTAFIEATREDFAEWMEFVAKQKPPFPRPGNSLPGEYERWLSARNKGRSETP